MPTFIDESGDTGPCAEVAHGYFRLAAVYVPSHEEVEAIRAEIRVVRAALGLRADYEFKFAKTWKYPERREAFFHAVMERDFRFAFTSIDKTRPEWKYAGKEEIHRSASTDLAATLRPTYLAAHRSRVLNISDSLAKEQVIIDDNRDNTFLAMVKQQFRGLGKTYDPPLFLVGKVKFRDSLHEELIQLADMICGAAGANLDGKPTWYRMIEERDLSLLGKKKRAGELRNSPPYRNQVAQSSAEPNPVRSRSISSYQPSGYGTCP